MLGDLNAFSGAYEYSEFGGSAIVIWFSSLFRTMKREIEALLENIKRGFTTPDLCSGAGSFCHPGSPNLPYLQLELVPLRYWATLIVSVDNKYLFYFF